MTTIVEFLEARKNGGVLVSGGKALKSRYNGKVNPKFYEPMRTTNWAVNIQLPKSLKENWK